MAHIITVTRNRYNDDGTKQIDESISINADNINIVEDSILDTREKSRIIFNDGSDVYMIETKEEIERIINLK
ncbi:hypothetical protein L5F33_07235 [Aliarcobacter butzleri]|uniref:hypothetical protein n=1 Tax=Aliarcobacter butzleri TaxID=28197 RepID=UPI001EE0DC37|nr:hypothetical protein [Aliarcobacter butzleri]MCG3670047.1 hypothetical protein [Aliarcobacter butzleri]